MSHAQTGCHTSSESLALNWMYGRLDAYGECRDSERTLCVREPVGMANCVDSHAQTGCYTSSESLALNWMYGRLDAYVECLFFAHSVSFCTLISPSGPICKTAKLQISLLARTEEGFFGSPKRHPGLMK